MTEYGRGDSARTRPYGGYGDAGRRRSRRRLRITVIILIILVALLTGLDFGARAFAESRVAAELQQQGFPKKPSVSIAGFPFLTQVIGRDFRDVQIRSSNVTEGPLEIASVNATMNGVHVNSSFNGGHVDRLNGTIDVTFTALANAMTSEAGGLGAALGKTGLTLSRAGPDEVKSTLDLPVTSVTAVWRITRTGHNTINIHLVSRSGPTSGLLSSLGDINVPLPSLPMGLSIQRVSVIPNGLVGTVSGRNVRFGGSP